MCPFCKTVKSLGIVQAESAYEAKQQAEVIWPDARYEEMVARRIIEHRSASPVAQEVA
jgi:hypothetical protein